MPKAKKALKKTTASKNNKPSKVKVESTVYNNDQEAKIPSLGKATKKTKVLPIVAVVLVIVFVILIQKGVFVAAVVNNRPIFQWDIIKLMYQRFGNQTLEALITEKLIDTTANQKGIEIKKEEIDGRIGEMIKNVGGDVSIDEFLAFQGITKADFERQIKTQIAVEKILSQDISISESDIDLYIASNAARLTATDEGELRQEARTLLLNELIGQRVQPWFLELKEKANIYKFVKSEL